MTAGSFQVLPSTPENLLELYRCRQSLIKLFQIKINNWRTDERLRMDLIVHGIELIQAYEIEDPSVMIRTQAEELFAKMVEYLMSLTLFVLA
jgi:hypothetical protein